jgi:cobalt-zinc-cadmium efflux system outer membrane protein
MFYKIVSALLLLVICSFFTVLPAPAQPPLPDTLKLTVKEAEDRFLKSNLQIIIQRFNIDNDSSAIITAPLFPNPDFSFNNSIHTNDVTQTVFN